MKVLKSINDDELLNFQRVCSEPSPMLSRCPACCVLHLDNILHVCVIKYVTLVLDHAGSLHHAAVQLRQEHRAVLW